MRPALSSEDIQSEGKFLLSPKHLHVHPVISVSPQHKQILICRFLINNNDINNSCELDLGCRNSYTNFLLLLPIWLDLV